MTTRESGPLVIGPNNTAPTVSGKGIEIVAGNLQLDAGNIVLTAGTVGNSGGFAADKITNITAGTTQTQAGATAITSSVPVVTTTTAGDGVILPALSPSLIGTRVQLINKSSNAGTVYCPGATSTNTINGTAGATGVAYAASKTLFLIAVSATAWVSTLSN